jgi:hypothetical protein
VVDVERDLDLAGSRSGSRKVHDDASQGSHVEARAGLKSSRFVTTHRWARIWMGSVPVCVTVKLV